jgi:FkbM family methyltransferase
MVEFNELKNVSLVNKAIYIKSGEFPLFHSEDGNKTMSSLHTAVGTKESELVKAITLGDLFKQEKIDHVDLLKMDIEGSETEVLSSTSFKDVADKIDLLIVERHAWSGRHPQQLTDALKNAGFNVGTVSSSADLIVAKHI